MTTVPRFWLCSAGGACLAGMALAADIPPASATNLSFTTVVAIQTRLDRMNLSCGCIDGKLGAKTFDAVDAWRKNAGLARTNVTPQTLAILLGSKEGIFTEHVVTDQARMTLTPIPSTWAAKAALAAMGYETILEEVAERYHSSEAVIRLLNPRAPWPNPPPGCCLRVPNPFPAARARAARVEISLARKIIRALDDKGDIVAHFPCTIAAKMEKRPIGVLTITTLVEHPNYTFDPALFTEDAEARTMTSKALLAPGPNNPVGTIWIGLDKPGYGIHGTPHPEDIGKTASHGCFRLANWNAEKLVAMVSLGTPVVITDE